ncbi:hypothetical protein LX32DRAFT_284587 [Colletotrichum zoysiae]|uniref:Uncharacterized protein n=1 Tax=Colletotrichum zoysiae TaxID=1216348 RepID=A0AAD9M250_9PEZI|nr:hypothetical protein LX32DRAFT_284587 [Colletotrichum zoysiae]
MQAFQRLITETRHWFVRSRCAWYPDSSTNPVLRPLHARKHPVVTFTACNPLHIEKPLHQSRLFPPVMTVMPVTQPYQPTPDKRDVSSHISTRTFALERSVRVRVHAIRRYQPTLKLTRKREPKVEAGPITAQPQLANHLEPTRLPLPLPIHNGCRPRPAPNVGTRCSARRGAIKKKFFLLPSCLPVPTN